MTKINMVKGKRGADVPSFGTSLIFAAALIVVVLLGIYYFTKAGKESAGVFYKGVNVDLVKQACQTACSTGSFYDFCNIIRTVKYEDKEGKQQEFQATCIDIANRKGKAQVLPKTEDIKFPDCPEAKCSSITTAPKTLAQVKADCNKICTDASAEIAVLDANKPADKTVIDAKKKEACCSQMTYKADDSTITTTCANSALTANDCSAGQFCAGVSCD